MPAGRPRPTPVIPLPGERWLPAPGHEARWCVSDQGRVMSKKRLINHPHNGLIPVPETLLRPHVNGKGYLELSVKLGDTIKQFRVHRLVALAFVPRPDDPEATDVNHRDGDKLNNLPSNLQWCTAGFNSLHGRYVLGAGSMRLTDDQVRKGREEYRRGVRIMDLKRRYGVGYATAWEAFHPQGALYRHIPWEGSHTPGDHALLLDWLTKA